MTLAPCSLSDAALLPFDDRPDAPVRLYALIPSAGTGSRCGADGPKQYQLLAGQRVIDHTVAAFLQVPALSGVGVVVAPTDTVYRSPHARVRVWHVGGATRAASVFQGLQALAGAGARSQDWVLVHDAARCLIRPQDIEALLHACADDAVGGLLALPLPDTLKQAVDADGQQRISCTIERADKWLAQTPQMFRWGALYQALAAHAGSGFAGITDEASAIESTGLSPRLVPGSAQNFKVTYAQDFALAEALLLGRGALRTQGMCMSEDRMDGPAPAPGVAPWRVGEGWDVHALVPGRPLILGGVHIPHHSGLLGHSDADALLHAITDALLGAAGQGDIGTWFPDTDASFKGADSAVLLAEAARGVAALGYRVANVDCTVIAQAPRLADYKPAMRQRIAAVLGIAAEQVNVKAKTAEKLGPVGQGLSIESRAVVLLYQAP